MTHFDFTKHDDSKLGAYSVVTPGTYLCKMKCVTVDSTKSGDVMWKLEMVIEEECQFYGKLLFDNLIFSEKAAARAKHILKGFGIDVEVPRDFQPDELLEHYSLVTVDRTEKYKTNEGKEREKSVIAYSGYKPITESQTSEVADEDIPF